MGSKGYFNSTAIYELLRYLQKQEIFQEEELEKCRQLEETSSICSTENNSLCILKVCVWYREVAVTVVVMRKLAVRANRGDNCTELCQST